MNNPNTTPGKTYAVTSPNGCTVTTEDGLTLAEIEAGKQGYFVAVSGNVTLSDDSAILTPVFKLAPYQRLRLLGVVGGGTPAWLKELKAELAALLDGSQFDIAWLADEKTLVVHTDRVSDELLAAVKATAEAAMPATAVLVQYNHNMEISWRDINKYALCKNTQDMLNVNSNYGFDVTSDGEWVYPLPEMEDANAPVPMEGFQTTAECSLFGRAYGGDVEKFAGALPKAKNISNIFRKNHTVRVIKLYAPIATDITASIDCNNLEELELYVPECKNTEWDGSISWGHLNTKLKRAKIYLPKAIKFRFGAPALQELELELPSLAAGTNRNLLSAQLNKESTQRLLNSFPMLGDGKSGKFTIGIHVDHKTDEEVLAAIANAEAKGWTLTVQWNGTPTSTASTMAMGTLIYAKVGEHELPDGTAEQYLVWGHYVTNPEGYETFRSLASAYRYFGIPMPDDLTNN